MPSVEVPGGRRVPVFSRDGFLYAVASLLWDRFVPLDVFGDLLDSWWYTYEGEPA